MPPLFASLPDLTHRLEVEEDFPTRRALPMLKMGHDSSIIERIVSSYATKGIPATLGAGQHIFGKFDSIRRNAWMI